jgi:hypothetical protein
MSEMLTNVQSEILKGKERLEELDVIERII